MRLGTILSLPDEYSQYARIKDRDGSSYTVDAGQVPKNAKIGDKYAYKVELWENGGGLAYELKEED